MQVQDLNTSRVMVVLFFVISIYMQYIVIPSWLLVCVHVYPVLDYPARA